MARGIVSALALFGLVVAVAAADDLWGNCKDSPFRPEKKKFQEHDIVTIKVQEKDQASADTNLTTDRRSRWGAALNKWIKIADTDNGLRLRAAEGPVHKKALPTPQIDAEDRWRQDNTGTMLKDSSLTFEISAIVVQVLPNGNLIVEAKKTMQIDGQCETMTLSGQIRQDDVDPSTNTVDSDRVADAQLKYEGTGTLGDLGHQGWFSKIVNQIWPFW